MVPSDLQGNALEPLTALKDSHPELYANYIQKYANRMEVMDTQIPILDCKWNDAIHLLPIHPKYIHELFAEVGMRLQRPTSSSMPPRSIKTNLSSGSIRLMHVLWIQRQNSLNVSIQIIMKACIVSCQKNGR
jgi:hypothetical protein